VILHGARVTLRANSGGANSTVTRMGENAEAPFVCRRHSLEIRRRTVFASWLTGPAVIGRWGRSPTLELRGPGVARFPSAGAGVPTSGGGSKRVRFSHRNLGLREFVRFLQRSARFIVIAQPARWVSKRHHPQRRIAQRPTLRDPSCKPQFAEQIGMRRMAIQFTGRFVVRCQGRQGVMGRSRSDLPWFGSGCCSNRGFVEASLTASNRPSPVRRDASCKPDLQSKPGYPAAHPTRRLGRGFPTSPGNARKANPT
jgi:hypothetical protein